jgi:hypothetical protein
MHLRSRVRQLEHRSAVHRRVVVLWPAEFRDDTDDIGRTNHPDLRPDDLVIQIRFVDKGISE